MYEVNGKRVWGIERISKREWEQATECTGMSEATQPEYLIFDEVYGPSA